MDEIAGIVCQNLSRVVKLGLPGMIGIAAIAAGILML